MQIYLVGGAVRDELLGLPVKERDWVVVGATPEAMLELGYKPVGKDFPVFLHPRTHEEYALARTERKTGKGYKGFVFYTDPNVTLAQDLKRRDLTINAMARSENGELIDPYGGQQDLQERWLHHVSEAFAEDPVRILRLARFAARFADFKVHPKTLQFMQAMVASGEIEALVAERVWQELEKALQEQAPECFLEILERCGALTKLAPELVNVQKAMEILSAAAALTQQSTPRFAALFYCLSPLAAKTLLERLRAPKHYKELALLTARARSLYETAATATPSELLEILTLCDALRRPERFAEFLLACEANLGSKAQALNQRLQQALDAASRVQLGTAQMKSLTPPEIAALWQKARVEAIAKVVK